MEIPKDISLDHIPPEDKFKKCHRNRGLQVYTFYHYARLQKEEKEKNKNSGSTE